MLLRQPAITVVDYNVEEELFRAKMSNNKFNYLLFHFTSYLGMTLHHSNNTHPPLYFLIKHNIMLTLASSLKINNTKTLVTLQNQDLWEAEENKRMNISSKQLHHSFKNLLWKYPS